MPTQGPSVDQLVLDQLARTEIDARVEGAIASLGEAGEAALLRVARGEVAAADRYQRGNAVYLVGRRAAKGASAELARLLDRETVPRVRLSIVTALGRIGDAGARTALVRLLQNATADRHEHIYALEGLAGAGAVDEIAALEALQIDASFPPLETRRREALEAIRKRQSPQKTATKGPAAAGPTQKD